MNLDDFRCMQAGKQLASLDPAGAKLLAPIEKRSKKHGHVLLMLHGFGSSPAVFRHMLEDLSAYDAIIAPCLPGHASNLQAFAEVQAQEWLDFVHELCGSLLKEFKQVDVLGLSLGGLLACHLAHHFQLHHLYLLAPAFDLEMKLSRVLRLAYFLKKIGFRATRNMAGNIFKSNSCEFAYRQLPLTTIMEIFSLIQSFPFNLPTCPTDLFLGRHDKVLHSDSIAERFAGKENIHIHWLENSAHVLPLDGDVHSIVKIINHRR